MAGWLHTIQVLHYERIDGSSNMKLSMAPVRTIEVLQYEIIDGSSTKGPIAPVRKHPSLQYERTNKRRKDGSSTNERTIAPVRMNERWLQYEPVDGSFQYEPPEHEERPTVRKDMIPS